MRKLVGFFFLIVAAAAAARQARAMPQESQAHPMPPPLQTVSLEDGPWRLVRIPYAPAPELGTDVWMMESDLVSRDDGTRILRVLRPMTFVGPGGSAWSWFREIYKLDCVAGRINLIQGVQSYADGKSSAPITSRSGLFETPTPHSPDAAVLAAGCSVLTGRVLPDDLPCAATTHDALSDSAAMEKARKRGE